MTDKVDQRFTVTITVPFLISAFTSEHENAQQLLEAMKKLIMCDGIDFMTINDVTAHTSFSPSIH